MRILRSLLPAVAAAALASQANAATIDVDIHNLQFTPSTVEAKVGDTIRWTNRDVLAHTATADGTWDVVIPAKQTGSIVLKSAGSFDYRCRFHSNMKGHVDISKP